MSTKLTGYVWDGCAASGMKLSSVAIMARLADFSNDEGVCWPSIETIARQIGAGMSTVRTAIARLEAEGWLTRKARRQGNRNASNVYQLNVAKLQAAAFSQLSDSDQSKSDASKSDPSKFDASKSGKKAGFHPSESGGDPSVKSKHDPSDKKPSRPDASQPDTQTAEQDFLTRHPDAVVFSPKKRQWGTQDDLTCAQWLWKKIIALYEQAAECDGEVVRPKEPNWTAWANEIRLMCVQDGRTHKQICEMYSRVSRDPFWCRNVLSPSKLREKWDELSLRLSPSVSTYTEKREDPYFKSSYMRWEGVSDGLKVTAGSVIQRDDLVQYTATADATSSGGVLRVPIACSSAGAVGNADDGTSLILVTPVNGLPSSGVADTLTGGFDTEELEMWRARVIERYYWTPQGGADGDYVVWAKEVPGITRAWTYRHWMGTGTVGVMIASSDLINPIPEESTETAARLHIEPLAPVAGSDLYVFRPVAHTVDFHIRVTPDTPEIRAAITAELRSFLLRDGYPQGELKVSRISEAISGANGEYSHQLLAPADNISIAKNELAVLGTISWT